MDFFHQRNDRYLIIAPQKERFSSNLQYKSIAILALKILLLLILNTSPSSALAMKAKTPESYILATGDKKGIYFSLGESISREARKYNLNIMNLPSEGSLENLRLISEGKAQLCIAQSDAVFSALNGIFPFQNRMSNIQSVALLHTEALHILVRQGLYISRVEHFRGKRISIGPKGSGTEANARSLIGAAGISTNEFDRLHLDSNEAIQAMKSAAIDIVFFTSGFPNEAIETMARDTQARLLRPETELLERVLSACPFFVATTIPARTYTGQEEDLLTLGVPAMLVVRSDMAPNLGYLIAKIAYNIQSFSKNNLPIGIPIDLHQGAQQLYREKGLYKKDILKLLGLAILLSSLAIVFVHNYKDIVFFFKKHAIARVFVLIIITWIGGSIFLYWSEHLVNDSYSNPWRAPWSSLMNWLNFGSKEPITTSGRVVSVAMIILGAGCIAWLTAEIASIFVAKKIGEKFVTKHIRNHYVIINWNNRGIGIIEQLRDPELQQRPIIILTKKKDPPPSALSFKSIHHIYDVQIGDSILNLAKLKDAKTIIILADECLNYETADAETILILLATWKSIQKHDKQPKIIAEILQPQRVELAKCAGMLKDGNVEIVSSMRLVQKLIAQVAVTPGLTNIYDDLLTFGSHTNEIYCHELSKEFSGRTFEDIIRSALALRDRGICFIPIAIYRNNRTYINPTQKELGNLIDQDIIYAISDDRKSLKRGIKMIAKDLA